ncbi:hypothetical protein LTR56_007804 [Elasticomyces elasticus]|nr:hypothetical protein LTR56_007804 [Elasticomyces elasticus]KAK3667853.1 hypothetical protein LTR22_001298 [Elasticomyces elasticus]KAK5763466.1 hypothetical protein LTS12_006437 [Elasticomyces elasticus]
MARTIQTARKSESSTAVRAWTDRGWKKELERRKRECQAMTDELRARGVRVDEDLTHERLGAMLRRLNSGWLPYTNYSKKQLLGFCRARKVKDPRVKTRATKNDLVAALEAADAKPTFRPFFDLPAELRLMIVEAAGVDYEDVLGPRPKRAKLSRKMKSMETGAVTKRFSQRLLELKNR